MTKGARRTLAVLLSGALVFGGTGDLLAATKKVRAKGNKWRAVHNYIGRGDRIKWVNKTNRVHDLKAWGGGWRIKKVLRRGDTAVKKFNKRGTFKFRCVRHSAIVGGKCRGMCGFVHVVS